MKVQEIIRAAKQLAEPSEELWSRIKSRLAMEVPLTQGYIALVDPEDYMRVMKFKWYAGVKRSKDGKVERVYARRTDNGKDGKNRAVLLHHFILGTSVQVDHWDRDTLNNRKKNLRLATGTQNNANQGLSKANSSGFKGVSWYPRLRKWQAYISVNGKRKHLGLFTDKKEAAKAYDRAARTYFKEFALSNLKS